MRNLNVLMLGWEFPPVINGGLGVACLGISKALAPHVNLSLILPKTDPNFIVNQVELLGLNQVKKEDLDIAVDHVDYKVFSSVENIETAINPYHTEKSTNVHNHAEKKHLTEWVKEEGGLEAFKSGEIYGDDIIKNVIQYARVAALLSRQKQFDVIHAHDWMTFLAGIEIKKYSGKPLVLHVHSLDYDRCGAESRGWIYDLEKYAMEVADALIPVSIYTGSIISRHYGISEEKIFPIHNGADPVMPYRKQKAFKEKVVLFLGRVTLQKGPEFFLEVADKVIKDCKSVRFVMAGTGDKLKSIIESGAYKHLGSKFHFTGFLNKQKVNELLSMADVYCMPSVSEPFGLSALEAAQFGIPAVISKQSGAAEVLDGALKADYWDINLISRHIVSMLENEGLKETAVRKNFESLKGLTWEKSAEKILDVYKKVISDESDMYLLSSASA